MVSSPQDSEQPAKGMVLLANALVFLAIGSLIFAILNVADEWKAPFQAKTEIDLSYWKLPQYTLYSMARGWVALLLSMVFAIGYATWAYYDRRARSLLLPILDILQSIPVLGFMPGLVLALVFLFPKSNFGIELACVLMIFTAQVWNMVFSYYDSLKAIPVELRQMGEICGFGPVKRFLRIELPFAAQGLIYNCMVSMAGGWFFLTINEAFTLGNKDFQLPGLGSYMSEAIAQNNAGAQIAAVVAMGVMIIGVDRIIWWPLVVWSRKFKLEDTASGPRETTIIGQLVAQSGFLSMLMHSHRHVGHRIAQALPQAHLPHISANPLGNFPVAKASSWALRGVYGLVLLVALVFGTFGLFQLLKMISTMTGAEWVELLTGTAATFARVLAALIISSAWTIPVGVWIGMNPKLARPLQPVIQFAASFPAPMLYPIVFGLILAMGGTLQWGAVVLMMLGAQWYILFNVAAGAQAIPADMVACADIFKLKSWRRWKNFILPAIFPFLLTGWITSAGGAWNASIVSEYLQKGDTTYVATGLGAIISQATNDGNFDLLAASIVVMAVCVVAINRNVWRRLQKKADLYCRFGG